MKNAFITGFRFVTNVTCSYYLIVCGRNGWLCRFIMKMEMLPEKHRSAGDDFQNFDEQRKGYGVLCKIDLLTIT